MLWVVQVDQIKPSHLPLACYPAHHIVSELAAVLLEHQVPPGLHGVEAGRKLEGAVLRHSTRYLVIRCVMLGLCVGPCTGVGRAGAGAGLTAVDRGTCRTHMHDKAGWWRAVRNSLSTGVWATHSCVHAGMTPVTPTWVSSRWGRSSIHHPTGSWAVTQLSGPRPARDPLNTAVTALKCPCPPSPNLASLSSSSGSTRCACACRCAATSCSVGRLGRAPLRDTASAPAAAANCRHCCSGHASTRHTAKPALNASPVGGTQKQQP